MPRYIYRYQTFIDGKATTYCAFESDPRFMEVIAVEGSCTRYARHLSNGMTRVKPRNVLTLPEGVWPPYPRNVVARSDFERHYARVDNFIQSFSVIPWSVDLSTVNLEDYPELFI